MDEPWANESDAFWRAVIRKFGGNCPLKRREIEAAIEKFRSAQAGLSAAIVGNK